MEILVHQPSEVEIGNDNYEVMSPINFHNMYLSLHDKYENTTLDINDESYLKGYIKVKTAYQYAIDFLESIYTEYGLHINMTDTDPYYEFEDLNTQTGAANLWGGSNPGMSLSQMRNVTLWPKSAVLKGTKYWKDAVKFNEFVLFSRLTTPAYAGTFREMPLLEEIDCTNLTKMTEYFLWKCPNLKKIGATEDNELPNLRNIEKYVFNYDPIEKISIPRLLDTKIECCFYQCKKLREAHIDGPNLTEIGYQLFYENTALETVTGFSNVTKISSNAFKGCTFLQNIPDFSNVTQYGENCFNGCSELDFDLSNARIIDDYAFNNSGITVANLESIESLGRAFQYCNNLREVYLNENFKNYTITSTFYKCQTLETINLDNCKVIGDGAFRDCISLYDIGNTTSLTKFEGGQNFYNTPLLESINLHNVTSIPSNCFSYSGIKNLGDTSNIEKIDSGAFFYSGLTGDISFENLEILGNQAFRACPNITSLNLGNITYINSSDPNENYRDCTSLQTFTANLTTISRNDFLNCSSLNTVNIPEVTSIGSSAFSGCRSLQTINGPKVKIINNNAFRSTGIINISLPLLETIGDEAFRELTSIESIDFPSLQSVGSYGFYYCKNLLTVSEMPALTSLSNSAFDYCQSLTGTFNAPNLTNIGAWAFSHCESLKHIILGNVTNVPTGAFHQCYLLEDINSSTWQTVARNAMLQDARVKTLDLSNVTAFTSENNEGNHFREMTLLETVTSLENLELVQGNDSFYNCRKLVTAPISTKLTVINDYFFEECQALENCGDLTAVTSIGKRAFWHTYALNYNGNLPNVEYMAEQAFYESNIGPNLNLPKWSTYSSGSDQGYFCNCKNIVTVNIPSLNIIPKSTFNGCSNLESVTFSENLTELGYYSFHSCKKLNNVVLPETVTTLRDQVFYGCTGLKVMTVKAVTPPACSNGDPFANVTLDHLYVPAESVNAYKTANRWSKFASVVSAIPS